MPTNLQSETARRNGAKSNGPKTAAGKSRSSMNGLKHGLRAKTLVLPFEDAQAFESLKSAFLTRFQPNDDTEAVLVNQLIATSWRLERFLNIETHLLGIAVLDAEEYIEENFDIADNDDRLAVAFRRACEHPSLIHLHRQINLLHRQFDRILQTFLKLKNATSEPKQQSTPFPINNIQSTPQEPNHAPTPAKPSE